MPYLTGKRFEYLRGDNAAGTKTGVIVSEPFRDIDALNGDNQPIAWSTNVAVLWDDGSMEGAVDIETLKAVEEDTGYVVCLTFEKDALGEMVSETYLKHSTLHQAEKRAQRFKDQNPRIGKIIFPFENN